MLKKDKKAKSNAKFKSYEGALGNVKMFSGNLPSTLSLVLFLTVFGIAIGVISSAFVNHTVFLHDIYGIFVSGFLVGIIDIVIPTILTVITLKILKRHIVFKYILFSSMIATFVYSVFIILSTAVFAITGIYAISLIIILLGDASIYGWWFFISKVLLNEKRASGIPSLLQPTLNILFFIPISPILFIVSISLKVLLIKLYFAIFIFVITTYVIVYFIDSPIKKSLGYSGLDFFTQIIQNWLFNTNITITPSPQTSKSYDINSDSILFTDLKGSKKGVFFIPDIHYGPMGTVGSSNFPYMLEKYSNMRYKSNTTIMHPTVSDDHNVLSSDEYYKVKNSFDQGIQNALKSKGCKKMEFYYAKYKNSQVNLIKFDSFGIATFTRAPRVTEDVTPAACTLFKQQLEKYVKNPITIDAHNSRYETAPKEELAAVKYNSRIAKDYLNAIKNLKLIHKGKLRFGSYSFNPQKIIKCGVDIAPGNINISIFDFGKFKYCMIYFNANNIKPSFRDLIIDHIKKKYNMSAEIYSTDTHFVNSLNLTASNVLGSKTRYSKSFQNMIDEGIDKALNNISECEVHHSSVEIKNIKIWGANGRERIVTTLNSMVSTAKIAVPIIIIFGFFVAAWIIYII